jgi:hypothetical protein
MEKICFKHVGPGPTDDNTAAVKAFLGQQPRCRICKGRGTYGSPDSRRVCYLCNSRLIIFVDAYGFPQYLDWGDTVIKTPDGFIKEED